MSEPVVVKVTGTVWAGHIGTVEHAGPEVSIVKVEPSGARVKIPRDQLKVLR